MYNDHRLGLVALALLGLPFALTFLLIALIGVASACLLLGHIGALLSQILQLILPIPILATYLTALASPYSLLIATTLAGGLAGIWVYFSIQYDEVLVRYQNLGLNLQFPKKNPFPAMAGYMRKEIFKDLVHSSSTNNNNNNNNNNEEIDIDIAVDDRTVIHSPREDPAAAATATATATTENMKPELLSDSNPFIRRLSSPQPALRNNNNNTDYDNSLSHQMQYHSRSQQQQRQQQQQQQRGLLRPTAANVFEFTPKRHTTTSGVGAGAGGMGCVSEWDEVHGRWGLTTRASTR